jgi:NADPH:quinone reductase-like Zn-dependent oxidoreductase
MKAIYLVRHGAAEQAFEWKEIPSKNPEADEVAIATEAAGINFADVVARLGDYQDCPPLPAVVGYEVVGRVVAIGSNVNDIQVGQRVLAFTRFGGYSEFVCQKALAVAPIPEDMPAGEALALATQYCTAYHASHVVTNIMPGDRVLIQAAAGGVGTALVQLCKLRGAYIYGTAGSEAKLKYMRTQGVDVAINYNKEDFSKVIKEPIDVAFDSLGGETYRKSFKLLNAGGRLVGYGAASLSDAPNLLVKGKRALEFGIYHPAPLLIASQSLIGINMLRLADSRPDVLAYSLRQVIELAAAGKIKPHVGKMYPASEIVQAHKDMQQRKTIGKIGIVF